jgi:hypothetical protein
MPASRTGGVHFTAAGAHFTAAGAHFTAAGAHFRVGACRVAPHPGELPGRSVAR